uniref:Uncharacterized protein n=1 Tax=Oryza glumipatula TaxID=40148 RepID=A0A0D9Z8Z2_9ORYZ
MDDLAVVSFAGGLEPSQKPPTSDEFQLPCGVSGRLVGFQLSSEVCVSPSEQESSCCIGLLMSVDENEEHDEEEEDARDDSIERLLFSVQLRGMVLVKKRRGSSLI